MSEPYTTQDSDYLSTHHTQAPSAGGPTTAVSGASGSNSASVAGAGSAARPKFLSTTNADDEAMGGRSEASASSETNTAAEIGPSASVNGGPTLPPSPALAASLPSVAKTGALSDAGHAAALTSGNTKRALKEMAPLEADTRRVSTLSAKRAASCLPGAHSQHTPEAALGADGSSRPSSSSGSASVGVPRSQTWPRTSFGPTVRASVSTSNLEASRHVSPRGMKRRGSDSAIVLQPRHGLGGKRKRGIAYSEGIFTGAATAASAPTSLGHATRQLPVIRRSEALAVARNDTKKPASKTQTGAAQTQAQAHSHSKSHTQTKAPSQASAVTATTAAAAGAQQSIAPPPINRYTLRELKIQNILQNPRLRHEVLFEPKLEFRPNSGGQLAETKQRAASQYWAGVESSLHQDGASAAATLTMLIVELREILAELAEDAPKPELARHATELRERLDDVRLRQQLARGVFDVSAAAAYLGSVMSALAPGERHAAAIARVGSYIARGRLVRGLRLAFDAAESIKIDVANASIELYRDYMRATAVAFERSHLNLAIRRGAFAGLADARDWWRRAVADSTETGAGLDAVYFSAARDLILDDGAMLPATFRMDDVRIAAMRREIERLSVAGTVYLAFGQFLQAAARLRAPAADVRTLEFRNAAGRVDHDALAAACLQLLPEGCMVQWTEPLRAPAAASGTAASAPSAASAAGELPLSTLVSGLLGLTARALGRPTLPSEAAMLERTLLRAARYECPLREVVEERVVAALRTHGSALALQRMRGSSLEVMPQQTVEALQRARLGFLQPALSALTLKIHAVLSHHWLVYKAFYAASSSSKCNGLLPESAASSTTTTTTAASSESAVATSGTPASAAL